MDSNTNHQPNKEGNELVNTLRSVDVLYHIAKRLLVILLVVALGFVVINQFVEFRYKAALVQQPCGLCSNLHPNQSKCIEGCFKQTIALYPDGFGKWKGENGKCYGFNGIEINCTNNPTANYNISIMP